MRRVLLPVLILALSGCAKKEWSKEALVNKCLKDFTKRNEKENIFPQEKLPALCDCVAEKMVANYKSEAEAERDEAGSTQIGKDCAIQTLQQ